MWVYVLSKTTTIIIFIINFKTMYGQYSIQNTSGYEVGLNTQVGIKYAWHNKLLYLIPLA